MKNYAEFAWEKTAALLAVDSPSGYTDRAAAWVKAEFEALGFAAKNTTKGGVIVDLGGRVNFYPCGINCYKRICQFIGSLS